MPDAASGIALRKISRNIHFLIAIYHIDFVSFKSTEKFSIQIYISDLIKSLGEMKICNIFKKGKNILRLRYNTQF